MSFPTLEKPIPVQFATSAAEAIKMEFPNRLSVGDNLQRAAGAISQIVLVREEANKQQFTSLAKRSGVGMPFDSSMSVPAPATNPVLETISGLVEGILRGESLDGQREAISRFMLNQEQRSKIISHLLLTHDYERLSRKLKLRAQLERKVEAAASRQDLNPSEVMALLLMTNDDIQTSTKAVKSSAENVDDVLALLEKADYKAQAQEAVLAQKYRGTTTPHGREIIRRLAHTIHKLQEKPQ